MSEKLRRRAEERLVETGEKGPSPPTHADDQELIHDLQVHQIELELQNEELLRTQASLEAAKEEFASLYNLAPVGHLSLDSVGVIRRHNVTFAELLGRAGEELIGRRLADFMTAESAQSLLSRFRAFFRSPEGKQIDAVFEDGVGDERILQLSGRRLPGVEEERPLLVVAVDVTEQRAAEKQVKELLEQKDLFLRELRHRTKNNYQTILSILSLGASAARGAETVEALQKVQSRIRTMLLAQEVLSETGANRNVYTRAYLGDLLHRLMEHLDPEGRVTLTTEIDDFSIDAGAADALGLVVNEAVTNAFKYAFRDREEGVLTVRLKEHSDRWVLSLRDDGPGVPAEKLSPGLGLNLVQALAEQLRGTSRFSGTGNGSCLELIVRRSP